jgi:hypothetical protein
MSEQSQLVRDVNGALGGEFGMVPQLEAARLAHENLTTAINTQGLDALTSLFNKSYDASAAIGELADAARRAIDRLTDGSGGGPDMAGALQGAGVSVP